MSELKQSIRSWYHKLSHHLQYNAKVAKNRKVGLRFTQADQTRLRSSSASER